jgi:Tol biopolymer transport system component
VRRKLVSFNAALFGPRARGRVFSSSHLALLALVAGSLSCRSFIGTPLPLEPQGADFTKLSADVAASWSPRGDLIVYHRRFGTPNQPAGIYLVRPDGTRSTFVTAAGFNLPTAPRLSPDGTLVALEGPGEIRIVRVVDGFSWSPFYTDNNSPASPDWSPDGSKIVYARGILAAGEAIDSAGIHIYDLLTGVDVPILGVGTGLAGDRPRWSPTGDAVAVQNGYPSGVLSVNPKTHGIDTLYVSDPSALIVGRLHWTRSSVLGRDVIVFSERDNVLGVRTWALDPITRQRFTLKLLRPSDAPSPDGRLLVYLAPQVRDSVPVLFCRDLLDTMGVTRRQITSY